jgi:6-pyruvoyltetrahydropterin/6-carboxytetrahydropterin synthase
MLGPGDPLIAALRAEHCKVHEVPGWPTVENVAAMIAAAATEVLQQAGAAPGCRATRVRVRETAANEATWLPN